MEQGSKKRTAAMYAAAPVITILIVGIVLWLKQIFPFGANTIDYYDMGQQIAAFYYHVYDALHGTKSLFYDWYSALGTNMTMNTSGCSSLSLFNLLLYLVPRDGILQALSLFTMFKMACMSFTMFVFLHRTIKADYLWELCFSVCYGICGFAMMYYITNQWLDVAVFLPLLIEALWRLLKEEKMSSYILYLTICLVGSYYQSCMILIFVVLGTGLYYLTIGSNEKEERRRAVWRLFIGTIAAVGISAFILIPQLVQTFGSTRFENNHKEGNFYLNILKQVKGAYTTRWWSLLGLSLPFAVILKGILEGLRRAGSWKNYKKSREYKEDQFFVLLIVMMCLELLFESINLMWHFGSYVGYPIRNGFIISLTVLTAACFYAKRNDGDRHTDVLRNLLPKAIPGLVMTGIFAGIVIVYYSSRTDWVLRSVFHLTALVCGVTFLIYTVLLWSDYTFTQDDAGRKQGFTRAAMLNLLLAEFLIFAYIMLGKPAYTTGYSEQAEQSGSYIAESNELVDELKIESSTIDRIKNPDTELNANYPFVMRRASLSNWTHMIEPSFQQGAVDWGYSIQYMRILDAGGTVFSDALMGVKQVISRNELPRELYTEKARTTVGSDTGQKEYILYDCNYTLPFGIVISGNHDEKETEGRFSMPNRLFALMQPQEKKVLIETVCTGEGMADAHQSLQITGRKVLYFSGMSADSDESNMEITVNGSQILIPTIGDTTQTRYPAYFNNNLVCLGVFEDEQVEIDVNFLNVDDALRTEQDECFAIGALDLSLLDALCDEYAAEETQADAAYSELSMTVDDAPKGSALLIPVKYDGGFTTRVNAVTVDTEQAFGIFTAVPLTEGSNEIEMNFFPRGMKAGCVISMLTLLMMNAVWYKTRHRAADTSKEQQTAYRVLWIVFLAGWAAAVLLIYVVPILYAPVALLCS